MWLKFGVAKLLCIYIGLTKFEENPEGSSFFCVDLTWNDPFTFSKTMLLQYHYYVKSLNQILLGKITPKDEF